MIGAIFKLSYNDETKEIEGGICGSCFFINSDYVITANHILSKDTFKPNLNFRDCQYWILLEDFVYEIFPEYFQEFPEIDLTIIKILNGNKKIVSYKISKEYSLETECYNEGFAESSMPKFDIIWKENRLFIDKCLNLRDLKKRSEGKISFIGNIELNASDIKLRKKKIIKCNYGDLKECLEDL